MYVSHLKGLLTRPDISAHEEGEMVGGHSLSKCCSPETQSVGAAESPTAPDMSARISRPQPAMKLLPPLSVQPHSCMDTLQTPHSITVDSDHMFRTGAENCTSVGLQLTIIFIVD